MDELLPPNSAPKPPLTMTTSTLVMNLQAMIPISCPEGKLVGVRSTAVTTPMTPVTLPSTAAPTTPKLWVTIAVKQFGLLRN